MVTIALVNVKESPAQANLRDCHAFFQVALSVRSPKGEACFVEPRPSFRGLDAEELSSALLHRNVKEFAVGHGAAVKWKSVGSFAARAAEVAIDFVPTATVYVMESNPAIPDAALSMLHLARSDRSSVINDLGGLVAGYREWIEARLNELATIGAEHPGLESAAAANLEECRECSARMERGVRLLAEDDGAWKAFRLMNEAMLLQRTRSDWIKAGRLELEPAESPVHRWRPFQIAFILLCMNGIARPDDDYSKRDVVDLLWFPTGGGKTEAYLGLIAFSVFSRRLANPKASGVTALMRYTLRLLTVQQFQRATLLIVCCEYLRRQRRGELGDEPISIGLWLGQGSTPNTLDEAKVAINKLRNNQPVEQANPMQLQLCPWCGSCLTPDSYWIAESPRRLVVSCRKKGCEYSDGLPVWVVDEDVYRAHPTLLIATVDKFALLSWKGETRSIFNRDLPGVPPPELIVQDELHLISGPLGTLTGLYETAVDQLSLDDNGHRPKIISSTATIRKAHSQIRALFARDSCQFPPPGLDIADSYFAVQAPEERCAARLYVGLMTPSTSHTTLLVRTYASLLQSAADADVPDEVRDAYWTLVGYFNSLRVLGGARMQVQDDVEDRLTLLAGRHSCMPRRLEPVIELTSRLSSADIPVNLAWLEKPFGTVTPKPVDVVLATNMISVGVDVDRLGLMVVMGQPQSTSEYIQSTSRIGRRHPGLVVTLYNSARSRDRSHYESFGAYHQLLYRRVEAVSVTPFSARARDRALHAVLVAIARNLIDGLNASDAAGGINRYASEIDAVTDAIMARAAYVDPKAAEDTGRQIVRIRRRWESSAHREMHDYGRPFSNSKDPCLLAVAGYKRKTNATFEAQLSMRDVDSESGLYLERQLSSGDADL